MAKKLPPGSRCLTPAEHAHVAKLLWRTTQAALGAKVGISGPMVWMALREKKPAVLRPEVIAALMAISREDLVPMRVRKMAGGTSPNTHAK